MNVVEFTAESSSSAASVIPSEIVSQLPETGAVHIIVLVDGTPAEEARWRTASYEQFLSDDDPEDAIYDSLR